MPKRRRKKILLPTKDLPESLSIEEILIDVVAILVTHTSVNHLDEYTAKFIPKNTSIFVQNSVDKKLITSYKSADINVPFKGIILTKTGG